MLLRINLLVLDDHSSNDQLWSAMRLHFPFTKTSFLLQRLYLVKWETTAYSRNNFFFFSTGSSTSDTRYLWIFILLEKRWETKSRFGNRTNPKILEKKSTQLRFKRFLYNFDILGTFLDPILPWKGNFVTLFIFLFRNFWNDLKIFIFIFIRRIFYIYVPSLQQTQRRSWNSRR